MNEQLVSQVEDLGLSQKEARVYVANLMLGPATVQKIADFSGIKRVTTYVILEALVNLGLASQTSKGKKTYFSAEDPAKLLRLLSKKEQEIKEQKHSFEEVLPQLQALKSLPNDSPSVKFYDSAEGIRAVVSSFYAEHKDEKYDQAFGITNADQLHAFFPEIAANQANPARIEVDVASKVIYTSKDGSVFKDTDKQRNRQSRWVPPDKYPLNGDLSIMGNHVIMLSLVGSKPIGVTIESAELARSMKALFDLAWQSAAKYN